MTPLEKLQRLLDQHEEKERRSANALAAVQGAERTLDARLHPYQVRAVGHLHDNPRAGLFLEMGLGKTATVLQALTNPHLPVLVIAPKRVAENVWKAERDIWRPDLSIVIAAGNARQREKALYSGAQITVIGRDNIKNVPVGKFKTIVLDELSGFKSRQSQRWAAAKQICKEADYVWGLTGTPSPNGYLDLWAQIYLLDEGERLGKGITRFRSRYFTPGRTLPTGVVTEWLIRKEAPDKINALLDDICLSMKSEDYLDLSPTTHNVVRVPLTSKVAAMYSQMEQTLVIEDVEGRTHSAPSAAVLTGKLSQITTGILYPDAGDDGPWTDLHDEKIKAVQEIVDGTGSPVLVFYRFVAELEKLEKALPQAVHIDAKNSIEEWNAGRIPVLLAHPASAGHGLNLQRGGHTIVWSTMSWSLEEYEQGNARLARQGQKHPVVVHHLVSPNTIDEAILTRLREKKSVQDALMEYLK